MESTARDEIARAASPIIEGIKKWWNRLMSPIPDDVDRMRSRVILVGTTAMALTSLHQAGVLVSQSVADVCGYIMVFSIGIVISLSLMEAPVNNEVKNNEDADREEEQVGWEGEEQTPQVQ